jgi:peptidoglycan-associated lipoprotein
VITFDFNEYSIRLDQEAMIADNAACLKDLMTLHRVEGHCDDRGSDEYNLALGQRRAGAVARHYKALGVGSKQVSIISWGEEQPICTSLAEDCWNQNRRVETVPQ